jgi:putative oxidoreductase
MSFFAKIHALLVKLGWLLQTPVLLVIRLYWGYQFIQTGTGKLKHLDKVTGYFASLNIPAPKLSAIMAASTETIGGALLIVGLCSRFASAALVCVMGVAFYTADHEAVVGIFKEPDKFLGADPFLFLYASVLIFCFGPGWASIDAFLFKEKSV